MNYTTHYNLNKPEPAEQYNITHWNQNSDTVDTALYNEVERATSAEGTFSFCSKRRYWYGNNSNCT